MHVLKLPSRRQSGMFGMFAILLLGLLLDGNLLAATLDPAVLPKIQAATFEVVAAKPVNDPLTYEKPLPLELLPFQERNDKYYSIGTAFAIGNNRFATAGHVLKIGIGSLWGPPALRDASGHVYAIDKIEKYSLQQDFVVFTLVDPPKISALDINPKPSMNDVVYAVGNALGTGVVIRDGLYTSDTPEDQDGRWKWMRFSAAASPGNSGGPLLDKDGRIIGIVLMKSANENLNYALPISLIMQAPDHLATIDTRAPYQLDIFDTVANGTFKAQFKLPLSLADFNNTFIKLESEYADQQLKALLAKDPDTLFPRGTGSNKLLHTVSRLHSFPGLITRSNTGEWDTVERSGGKIPLSANGYIVPGTAGHNILLHLRKPDNISAGQLYNDPAMLMNLVSKIGILTRAVGSEKIRVTSMGKPAQDTLYTDAWQRRWQIRVWDMPYANARIITFALPVPDGYAILLRFAAGDQEHDEQIDMQALTGFIDVSYDGTLAQWQDYLKNTTLLPAAFKDLKFDIDYGKRFGYNSKRIEFSFTPDLQKIDKDSKLTVGFSYFVDHSGEDHGKVVWDVSDVRVLADANTSDRVNVMRHVSPSDDLDDDYKSVWSKLQKRQHPYEGVAYSGDDEMSIATVVGKNDQGSNGVLYSLFYGVEGTRPADVMKTKLDLLSKSFRVIEP